MFIRWHKKGGKVHRIDNVISVFVVFTGDIHFHFSCRGKIMTDTLIKGTHFDFVSILDKEKQNVYKSS